MPARRTLRLLVVTVALGAALAACGNNTPAATTATTTPTSANTFVLDEWSIVPPKGNLTAGKVAITATNRGSETHELVIVRASDAASLPMNADGSVNEDKIPESKKAGEIEDLATGKSNTKTLDLPAGDYIAFCNIVDDMGNGSAKDTAPMGSGMNGGLNHVHFKQGMVNYFTIA